MNENLITELYNRALNKGYKKSREEFVALLGNDDEVYLDMFGYARSKGLVETPAEFSSLVSGGPSKKKELPRTAVLSQELEKQPKQSVLQAQAPDMASSLQGGLSASQESPKPLIPQQRAAAVSTAAPRPLVLPKEVAEVTRKKEEAVPEYVKPLLETVKPEMAEKREEVVVPQLNYQFGPLGFKFEQAGIGDYVDAIAPNGKKVRFSLDAWTESGATAEAAKLRAFIRDNTITIPKAKLAEIEKQYAVDNKKFISDKEVEEATSQVSFQANQLNKDIQDYYRSSKLLEEQSKILASMPVNDPARETLVQKYQAELQRLQAQAQSITDRQGDIGKRKSQLETAVGKYTEMKAQQGTWYSQLYDAPLRGIGNIISGGYGQMVDILEEVVTPLREFTGEPALIQSYVKYAEEEGMPTPERDKNGNISKTSFSKWLNSIGDKASEYRSRFIDERKKEEKQIDIEGKPITEILRGLPVKAIGTGDTEEYAQEIRKGLVPGAIYGALESVPSFLGGDKYSRTVRMFLQTDDAVMKEMESDPDFKNISEREKRLISTPIAIAGAALEEIGFRNIIANKGLLNKLTMSALGKAGATTTAKTFGDLVKNEVESGLARGALTIVGGALAEAETGAAQQAAELVVKDVYNVIKDKRNEDGEFMKMFNTPDSVKGYVKEILTAGVQEAIGGFVLGMPSAVAAAYREQGFKGMDDNTFKLFESAAGDEKIEKAFVTSLKDRVNNGEITLDQAKETLNDYRNSIGLFRALPEGLDTEGKKEAMNLLRERRDLERSIDGKDQALTKPQRDRIAAINEQLTKISEDAVQKQTTDEGVLRSQRPELGLQEMGEGDQKPQVPTTGAEAEVTPALTQEKVKAVPSDIIAKLGKLSGIQANWDMVGEGDFLSGKEGADAYTQRMLPNWNRESQLGNINPESELTYDIVKGEYGGIDQKNIIEAKDENGITVGVIKMDSDGGILHLAVAPEFRGKGVSERLYQELKANNPNVDLTKTKQRSIGLEKSLGAIAITEAYNKAKQDGSNPELVSAVEAAIPELAVSLKRPEVGVSPEAAPEITKEEAADSQAIEEGASVPIGSPEVITKASKGTAINFPEKPSALSFVTIKDKIDINKLIQEIIEKKQKVWFWMADQLGRGSYYDSVIEGYHYLDAGPSFALDPENRSKGVLWASGLPVKTLESQVAKADYIFFISGSPEKAKLFNRRVLDLIAERINKNSSFQAFKEAMNSFGKETNELKAIKDALNEVNSFEELAKSPKRKQFLISIGDVGKLKTMPSGSLKELLNSFNVFIDYNELRDGFFKDNDFKQNDIMLVGKPTGVGGTAPHSTYQNSILGEVVGVPDRKIDAWEIMPQAVKDKYAKVIGGKEEKTKPLQTKVIAAETGVVRELEGEPTAKARIEYGTPVSNEQGINDIEATVAQDARKKSVIDAVRIVTKLFKSLFPNGEIYVFDNQEDYSRQTKVLTKGEDSVGLFSYSKNPDGSLNVRIDIDLTRANATTVYHEIAHAVMLKTFGDNKAKFRQFRDQLTTVLKGSTVEKLNSFAKLYAENEQPEEWLVELAAVMADQDKSIKIDTITKIAAIVNKFVSELTNGLIKPFSETASKKEVIDFFNQMAVSIKTGQEIVTTEKAAPITAATKQARRVEQGPEGLPGYEKLIDDVVNTLIPNALKRRLSGQELIDLVKRFVSKSDVYKKADDIQKDAIIRQVNGMLAESYKEPPSINRILGRLKDVTKVTMTEKQALKNQIKALARGAKDATKAWTQASKELATAVQDLADTGRITAKQVAAVVSRFAKVNMFDDASIGRFVDYMSKVFANAEYAEQIATINKALPNAKKNIETKLGVSKNLIPVLRKLFAIKPTLIPDNLLSEYTALVSMMGERKSVLNLQESGEIMDTASKILSAVQEEQSLAYELADIYEQYPSKVLDEDGNVDYAETIKDMLSNNIITSADVEVMKKYKSIISPSIPAEPMTEQELADEKKALINLIQDADVDTTTLPSRDERDTATKLKRLLRSTDSLNALTNNELKNLLRVIDNINNGFLPNYAQLMIEKMDGAIPSDRVVQSIKKAKLLPLSKMYAKLKSLLIKGRKDAITLMFERNPIYYYDQLLGDFNTRAVYDAIFKPIADAYAAFKSSVISTQERLDNAFKAVEKSFKNNGDKVVMSKYKMTAYLLQLEYLSNPESNKVNPAIEFLDATIKKIRKGKTNYSERDAEMLQDIVDKYSTDGQIDADKLYNSFNEAEKKAIKTIQDINAEMTSKAEYIAGVLRGEKFTPINNYIHHDVMIESSPTEAMADADAISNFNSRMNPSTRAKSLMERTPGAKAIEFDILKSVNQAVSSQLMDYYLTAPIRTVRKTMNQIEKKLEEDKGVTSEQYKIFNAFNQALERAVETTLITSFKEGTLAEEIVDEISRQGYRAVLASVPRFISELISNVSAVLTAYSKQFGEGIKYFDVFASPDGVDIMKNVKSSATTRVYPAGSLSGQMVDPSILNQTSGIRGSRAKGYLANKVQQIYNNTLKKQKNFVELTADALISTPDKMVMRPTWFGAFALAFEEMTGVSPDMKKIAANDEQYMNENIAAIEFARDKADDASVKVGATDNPFMGILKGTATRNQSAWARAFNNFNNFMSRFLINEYVTARTGIYAAMGRGMISRAEGVKLLAAITLRMTVYSVLAPMLSNVLTKMVWGNDDEEPEDDKSLLQKIGQGLASTFTSLAFGRDFGNATKNIVNYGVEKVNAEYLDFLRNGEYDPYKDAIQYSMIPVDPKSAANTSAMDLVARMGGSMGPALRTGALLVEKGILKKGAPKEEEKEPETLKQLIKQQLGIKGKKEKFEETRGKELGVRIPFEVLGNLGYIPLYKDARNIMLKEVYKDLQKGKKSFGNKKELEKLLLQGYESKSDMRRYDPEMYEITFGEEGVFNLLNTGDYKDKLIDNVIDDIVRDIKDDLYQYTPKEKDGAFGGGAFGGDKFGGEKKKGESFGGGKFGE